MPKFIATTVALAGILATAGAFAQGPQPQGETMQQMPMQGMMQGQAGMMMGGCPMMQRMAALDARLRQLEERAGIPTPPASPGTIR